MANLIPIQYKSELPGVFVFHNLFITYFLPVKRHERSIWNENKIVNWRASCNWCHG